MAPANKSKTASPGTSGAAALWRVRSDDGHVFGPADLPTLQAWARDGRLAPTNTISSDGENWLPVSRLPGLDMDWVAEVSPGTFYGPVHRRALEELVRDASVPADAPVFRRQALDADDTASPPPPATPAAAAGPSAEEWEARLAAVQRDLAAKTAALEAQVRQARTEAEQARAQSGARDLEAEAERQEQAAAQARHQAELARRDGRISALEKELAALNQSTADRVVLETRLADLERERAAAQGRAASEREALDRQLQQARQSAREAEQAITAARRGQEAAERDRDAQHDAAQALRLRLDSLRKLLQQALSAAGGAEDTRATPTVIEAEPVAPGPAQPPPVRPGVSLANLEAQAQRELRRLGGKGPGPFAKS